MLTSLLVACASQPVPRVSYETAHQTYLRGDLNLAVRQLMPLASDGDLRAMRDLGRIYMSDSRHYDGAKGSGLLTQAADGGDAQAQYLISELTGLSDRTWLEKAAAQGLPQAEIQLGKDYLEGYGVTRDYGAAMSWFEKAAAAGDAEALDYEGYMYLQGLGVTKDQARGMALYQQAATAGDRKADLFLGACYRAGQCGLPNDPDLAAKYYQQAADIPMDDLASLADVQEDMLATIDSHKVYPKEAVLGGKTGVATVSFRCLDRTPSHIVVVKSTGDRVLDAAAIKAVQDSQFSERPLLLRQLTQYSVGINFMLGGH